MLTRAVKPSHNTRRMQRKNSNSDAKRSCKISILESVDYRRTIALHKYGITRLFRNDLSEEEFDNTSNKYVEEIKCPELVNLDGSLNQSECVKVMTNATNRWPLIGSFIAQQAMGTDDIAKLGVCFFYALVKL